MSGYVSVSLQPEQEKETLPEYQMCQVTLWCCLKLKQSTSKLRRFGIDFESSFVWVAEEDIPFVVASIKAPILRL